MIAIFAVEVYQAATRPIGSGEAYLYDRFVRPSARQVLAQELPDRDVLYALLEKRSVGLFHVSPFAVRIPALLFGMLYLWAIWRLARKLLFVSVIAAILPFAFNWFTRADGTGASVALIACAISLVVDRKAAGVCLGLAVAARLDFAIPAAVAALGILAFQRDWNDWTNRVLIPAVVMALIVLVLPLSHAHAAAESTPELTASQAANLRSVLKALRASAGTKPIRIAATPEAEPVVNFYRAQERATTWERATREDPAGGADYYVLPAAERRLHLIVLYRDGDFVLAQKS
jgi:hypothetical protein